MTFDSAFFANLLSIVIIDLTLAGDNAVVIAMAVRTLPEKQRRKGIILGAGAAVVVRVVITFFVSQLLVVPLVKLAGGLIILWISMKLFTTGTSSEHAPGREAANIWEAVKIIVVADITMGLDNMLAVGGASHGSLGLLLFGLGLSIPLVVLASDFLSRLMARHPIVVYIGAAVLGRVAGDMIATDPRVEAWLHPPLAAKYALEAALAAAIIVAGWAIQRRARLAVSVREERADRAA